MMVVGIKVKKEADNGNSTPHQYLSSLLSSTHDGVLTTATQNPINGDTALHKGSGEYSVWGVQCTVW
jgi:hypothetical protein